MTWCEERRQDNAGEKEQTEAGGLGHGDHGSSPSKKRR